MKNYLTFFVFLLINIGVLNKQKNNNLLLLLIIILYFFFVFDFFYVFIKEKFYYFSFKIILDNLKFRIKNFKLMFTNFKHIVNIKILTIKKYNLIIFKKGLPLNILIFTNINLYFFFTEIHDINKLVLLGYLGTQLILSNILIFQLILLLYNSIKYIYINKKIIIIKLIPFFITVGLSCLVIFLYPYEVLSFFFVIFLFFFMLLKRWLKKNVKFKIFFGICFILLPVLVVPWIVIGQYIAFFFFLLIIIIILLLL